jgi:quercetin dioxygenase-like cupin family protein
MGFWDLSNLDLAQFRPGIMSKAELGSNLVMVCMEIGPSMEDAGHEHAFDQCGVVLEGRIEMFNGDERKVLGPYDSYFLPAGQRHGWKTFDVPAKILDVTPKQK